MAWRDFLRVHPAAELFHLMGPAELKELGEDIKTNGLLQPIVLWRDGPDGEYLLLDGRNRLDAMELVGLPVAQHAESMLDEMGVTVEEPPIDPYDYVISSNVRRRHLNAKQKNDLIAKLIKLKPKMPNRQIAKLTDRSHPTVAKIRADLEASGDVEKITTSIDTRGRQQRAHKSKHPALSPKRRQPTTAQGQPADTPSCEAPPGTPTPALPADFFADFHRVDGELDTMLGRWHPRARQAVEAAGMVNTGSIDLTKAADLVAMVKRIHDRAAGLARSSYLLQDADAAREAVATELFAARRIGDLLIRLRGVGLWDDGRPGEGTRIGAQTGMLRLRQLGISRGQSREWQGWAKMPDEAFEALVQRQVEKKAPLLAPEDANDTDEKRRPEDRAEISGPSPLLPPATQSGAV